MPQASLAPVSPAEKAKWPRSASARAGGGAAPITIGLVNNMPDAALSATEAQFRRLIAGAAGDRDVTLKLFSIPEVARSETARDSMSASYASTESLPYAGVDALIVTGAEPLAADLRDEPYWAGLAALVDWAETHTVSTIWSCLAAHAAVLHLDGVERRPLPAKCSGVFSFDRAASHPLLAEQPVRLLTPHSRLNALDEGELAANGYKVLTRSDEVGVDAFVRQRRSLFVFLQGHPEYDAESLALEYRRDMRRFLRGERATHPGVPTGYFEPATERALLDLAAHAAADARASVLLECSKIIAADPPVARWSRSTTQLYRNWFDLIEAAVRAKAAARG